MATIKQTQSLGGNRLTQLLLKRYETISNAIGKLFGDTADEIVLRSDTAANVAAHLFARALHEDSNHELDWLWYAANMVTDAQRRHCLERALQINPDSEFARRALDKLAKRAAA